MPARLVPGYSHAPLRGCRGLKLAWVSASSVYSSFGDSCGSSPLILPLFFYSGLIAGSCFLLTSYKTEFAFNIPYHFFAFTLALTGAGVVLTSTTRPSLRGSRADHLIPLAWSPVLESDRKRSPDPYSARRRQHDPDRFSSDGFWVTLMLLVVGVCVRVEFARWVITHSQCARLNLTVCGDLEMSWKLLDWELNSPQPFVPVALASYDLFARPVEARHSSRNPHNIGFYLSRAIHSQWRYMIPMSVMTAGAALFYSSLPRPRSTFICAQASPYPISIPILQVAGSALDIVILILTCKIIYRGRPHGSLPPSNNLAALGWVFLVRSPSRRIELADETNCNTN